MEADNAITTSPFTPKQNEAIACLARGGKWEEAARAAGVHVQTIANWMRKPEFKQAIDVYSQKSIARREKSIESKMTQLELKALETLEEIMNNAQKDADRVNAAKAVLAHQNSRKSESNNGLLVNFAGLQFLGSPKPDDIVTGDVVNADE